MIAFKGLVSFFGKHPLLGSTSRSRRRDSHDVENLVNHFLQILHGFLPAIPGGPREILGDFGSLQDCASGGVGDVVKKHHALTNAPEEDEHRFVPSVRVPTPAVSAWLHSPNGLQEADAMISPLSLKDVSHVQEERDVGAPAGPGLREVRDGVENLPPRYHPGPKTRLPPDFGDPALKIGYVWPRQADANAGDENYCYSVTNGQGSIEGG